MLASCDAILRFSRDLSREQLLADERTVAAIERHLFILGDAAAHLDPRTTARHSDVPWSDRRHAQRAGTWLLEGRSGHLLGRFAQRRPGAAGAAQEDFFLSV